MSGIKNADGSINWDKIIINPVIESSWGNTSKTNNSTKTDMDILVNKIKNLKMVARVRKLLPWVENTPTEKYHEGIIMACDYMLDFINGGKC